VVWLGQGRNDGFGAGVNAGARAIRSRWILVLNPDTRVDGRSVRAMAAWAAEQGVVALGPLLRDARARLERSWVVRDSSLADLARMLASRAGWRPRPPAKPLDVAWLTGACLLVQRDAFEAVGGFDERYFLYFEDADLCLRLRARGGRLVVHPGFSGTHERGASARGLGAKHLAVYRSSQLRFLAGHRAAWRLRLARSHARRLVGAWSRAGSGDAEKEAATILAAALEESAGAR
jgi:N-acetylglucosaminyl-diphospho-decaprenol L-rhamnosyltransferase